MKINPKRIILDHYDSLIRRVDIHTESRLEQFTQHDRLERANYSIFLKERKSSEYDPFATKWKYQELEEIFGDLSSREPYSLENDFDVSSPQMMASRTLQSKFVPGVTTMWDYLNAIRDEAISELKKAEAENLAYYESNKQDVDKFIEEKSVQLKNEKDLEEAVKEKLFESKFCFLVEIDEKLAEAHKRGRFASNATAFNMYICVMDFYLEMYFQRVLRNVINYLFKSIFYVDWNLNLAYDGYHEQTLNKKLLFTEMLRLYANDLMRSLKAGSQILYCFRDQVVAIERVIYYLNFIDIKKIALDDHVSKPFQLDFSRLKSLELKFISPHMLTLDNLIGLDNLEYLSITAVTLGSRPFRGLTRVHNLITRECDFKNASPDLFECLSSLKVLKNLNARKASHIDHLFNSNTLECLTLNNWKSLSILKKMQSIKNLVYFSSHGPFAELTISPRKTHEFFAQIHNSYLKALSLGGNRFCRFDAQWLSGFTSLTHLVLSGNQIGVINLEYDFLIGLESISLESNNIQSLDFAFVHLTNLRDLDLGYNQRLRMSADVFAGLDKLEKLNLRYTPLSHKSNSIDKDLFKHLRCLKSLDISRNGLEKIDSLMFAHMSYLTQLNLSDNNLKFNRDTLAHVAPKLTHLDLRRNEIEVLDDEVFVEFERLEVLDLGGNKLVEVNDLTFKGLNQLNYLNLEDNRLLQRKNISANAFSHMKEVRVKVNISDFRDLSCEDADNLFGPSVTLVF